MKYKILIIEDEPDTSHFLALALEKEGFDVDTALTGMEGLVKIKQMEYDLIVLDLKMPKMTGDEVLAAIREMNPYLQVVIYTNYEQTPVMKKLINLGVEGYLRKGSDSNLWDIVAFIKQKLTPVDDEERKKLLDKLFEKMPIQQD